MELNQLKSFIEIARLKNLTRAAGKLNISQSALSSQIRLLEDEFALKLFDRSSRGMHLTESGRVLLSYAESVVAGAGEMLIKAREMRGKAYGTIKMGINTDGSFLKVSQVNRMLKKRYPDVHFVLVSSQTIRTPEMLRQGLIDLGFLFGEKSDHDILYHEVSRFNIAITVPRLIFSEESELDWPRLAKLPWVWSVSECPYYQAVLRKMAALNLEPNKYVDAMDESVVKELVMDGQGVAILREDDARYVVEHSNAYIWKGAMFEIPLQLVRLKQVRNDDMLNSVIKNILTLWRY